VRGGRGDVACLRGGRGVLHVRVHDRERVVCVCVYVCVCVLSCVRAHNLSRGCNFSRFHSALSEIFSFSLSEKTGLFLEAFSLRKQHPWRMSSHELNLDLWSNSLAINFAIGRFFWRQISVWSQRRLCSPERNSPGPISQRLIFIP
jgi:hypothetical protein